MLEQAQCTVANIRCEILKVYGRSRKKRVVKQELQGKGHDFVENFCKQNDVDMLDQTKPTLPVRPVSNETIVLQTFPQDVITNQDLNVLSIDTVVGNSTPKVIKNTNTQSKEINCLDKEDATQTNIKDSSLSQNDQTQRQNSLHTYEACINIAETKTDIESSSGKQNIIKKYQKIFLFI